MTKKQATANLVTPAHLEGLSFEAAMAELNKLVASMEAGELALEASVSAYQRGSDLVKYCASQLEKVEQQVKILEAGMLKPFADSGAAGGSTDTEDAV
ncbi:exodeoxyribonuclease VII small subunit [Undibacterium sp. TS12]|uniref:exodeoxyribonuclease VII small subunit n=1 Tax=Undibacterium sp. TS12 TaxID=2908202 RepID=UPI001F4C55B9|nr:exodeoxyribonuclease VII small subunit [Undibacterium sp. TS12]MCH8619623.1 exodeoxyribonuclease VII small subunit [Undibacterium sp. TS12]